MNSKIPPLPTILTMETKDISKEHIQWVSERTGLDFETVKTVLVADDELADLILDSFDN